MRALDRCFIILLAFLAGCATSHSPFTSKPTARPTGKRTTQVVSNFDRVDLLAIADWGMNNDVQRQVAGGMKALVERERVNGANFVGVICGGDNIYLRKITGVDDPRLRALFSDMYDPAVLNFPFYIAPGNHDYDEDKIKTELALNDIEPTHRGTMPSNYFRVDLPRGDSAPLVMLLVLDSERDKLGPEGFAEETAWLQTQLKSPRDASSWRISIQHHPLFSNGDHGDVGPLQVAWGEPFKLGGLDLSVAGHDHDLQHLDIVNWPFPFLLVGGGGAKTRPMRADARGPFSKQSHGFGHLTFTREKMIVSLCDETGKVIHQFERDHAGRVRVLESIASDPATPRTARTIVRPDLPATGPATNSSKND